MMAEYLDVDSSYISSCEKVESQFSLDILDKAVELFWCTIECFENEPSMLTAIPIVHSTKSLAIEVLKVFAAIIKIALNLRFMECLVEHEN